MLFIRMLGRLPFPILYMISDILAFLNYYIVGYRKAVIVKNLRIAFPDHTHEYRKSILKAFYKNLSDVVVETIKGLYISREELTKRVKFCNLEILEEAREKGQPIVLLSAHQGNWEWPMQAATIMFPVRFDGVYKPLKNKKFDDLIHEIRTRFGGTLIPKDKLVRNLAEKKGEIRVIGIIGDQRPMAGTPKYWGKLFGVDTPFFPGSQQVPVMTGSLTVFAKVIRIRRGYYEVEISRLAEPPYEKGGHEIIDKFIRKMEEMILEAPAHWLWSHNRWKYSREESERTK